jgi:hypothetical protein
MAETQTQELESRDANEVLHEVVDTLAGCIGELRILTQLLSFPEFGDRIKADESGNEEYEFQTIAAMIAHVDETVGKVQTLAVNNL